MICKENDNNNNSFYVVHPLFDKPEEKCKLEGLGLMKMSPMVKSSLLFLRLYLVFMVGLVFYRALNELGFI